MQLKDQTISGSEEVVDGNSYAGCVFENCKIIYRGGEIPAIANCQFNGCSWQFEDAAERTLNFMRMVYHGMGDGGPQLVESAFEQLRQPLK